jgi:guanine deaminase
LHGQLSSAAEPERHFDLLSHIEETLFRATPRPRIHWGLGPSSPERCTPALIARTMDLARRYGLPVVSHLYESKGMALQARHELAAHGGSLIRRLYAEGALGPEISFAHSVWLGAAEMDLLAETGAGCILNLQGNLKMKCGIPPIREMMRRAIRIGLGCDNCSCSDAQNMFAAMKLFSLLGAVSDVVKGPPLAVPALKAATEGGAAAMRLADRIGRIAPGYHADLTFLDLQDPSFVPLNSAARQLVNVEAGRTVRHVMVDGRFVLRDRCVVTVDEGAVFEQVARIMPRFREDFGAIAARIARLQPWLDAAQSMMDAAEVGFDRLPRLTC